MFAVFIKIVYYRINNIIFSNRRGNMAKNFESKEKNRSESHIEMLLNNLELSTDLGPVNREYNYKGRIRQSSKAVTSSLGTSVGINIFLLIFASPIIALFIFYLPAFIQNIIQQQGLNFTGGIGIDYGVINDTVKGLEILYDKSLFFVLCFLTPSFMILGIGMSGAYHCIRNMVWGAKVKLFKHFFRGIAKHWWKFLLTFTYLGLVATNLGASLCILLKDISILGSSSAGIWVWVVFSCLLALLSVIYCFYALPTYTQYSFSFKGYIKNALLLTTTTHVIVSMFFVLLAMTLPLLLLMVGFVKYIVIIYFAAFGLSQYIAFNLGFGQFINDNYIRNLYEVRIRNVQREQEKEKKKQNQQKKQARINSAKSYKKKK